MSRGGAGDVHWSTDEDLPDDLALSDNGQVYGTPSLTGEYEIIVVATDAMGRSVTESIRITIIDESASQNLLLSYLPEVSAGAPCTVKLQLKNGATIRTGKCGELRLYAGNILAGIPSPGIHKLELETERNGKTQKESLFWNVTALEEDTLHDFRIRKLAINRRGLVFAARCEWGGKPLLTPETPVVFELGGCIAVAEEGTVSRNGRRYRAIIQDGRQKIAVKLKQTPGNRTLAITVIIQRQEGVFERVSACSEQIGNELPLYGKVMIGQEIIHLTPLVRKQGSEDRPRARLVK
jgi:hypothetical protein